MAERARRFVERLGRPDTADALGAYLRRQRWFGGRARELVATRAIEAVPLRDRADLRLWSVLVRATYAEGDTDDYHLLLSVRTLADAVTSVEGDIRLVAVVEDDYTPVAICDALHDGAALAELWSAIAAGETHSGVHGEARCRNLRMDPPGANGVDPAGIHILPREQSNTSAVREDSELLKCLRRVSAGVSPELELTDALARAGFDRLAAPLGALEYHPSGDAEPTLLAIVQPFLRDAVEGWTLALASLRALYSAAEELTGEQVPVAADVDRLAAETTAFAPEAARLGRVTGEMHLAALRAGPGPELAARPVRREHLDAWAREMTGELDALLARRDPALDPLRERRAHLAAAFDEIRDTHGGMAVRVHGDYHLGQALRTGDGWMVIDFEGEPNLPLRERRLPASPLRDVAGMLRSLDYAAAAALAERLPPTDPYWTKLEPLGEAWAGAGRSAFWEAYTQVVEGSGLLPDGAGALVLLRAFELRKAVYEVRYELGHRPDWVDIPLGFLLARVPA